MPVINSDREDSENESDNEIDRPVDSKEKFVWKHNTVQRYFLYS